MTIIHGDIVFSENSDRLSVYEDSYIAVESGIVEGIYDTLPEMYSGLQVTDYGRALIIPAFSDLHIHAPQFAQRGTGMDLLLSDWLNTNTFPEEAKFSDSSYAQTVYSALADDMLRNGTFHACVFASLHGDTAYLLAQIMEKKGISGYAGKVNMDCGCPGYLRETAAESLKATEDFINHFEADAKVKPILTPRFAPTCSPELLAGLGKLGRKYGLGMQTHVVESKWEATESLKLFPERKSDSEIYEHYGLLDNGPNVFAHFIFPSENDIETAGKHGVFAVHCPDATNNIIAGIMPATMLKKREIPLAIGTDIGAGSRTTVYSQVASAVRISKLKAFYESESNRALLFPEAFYMATAGSGALFGKCGSFKKGYSFDALVIDFPDDGLPVLSPAERLERFCYNGDDRNIIHRYISGMEI